MFRFECPHPFSTQLPISKHRDKFSIWISALHIRVHILPYGILIHHVAILYSTSIPGTNTVLTSILCSALTMYIVYSTKLTSTVPGTGTYSTVVQYV